MFIYLRWCLGGHDARSVNTFMEVGKVDIKHQWPLPYMVVYCYSPYSYGL